MSMLSEIKELLIEAKDALKDDVIGKIDLVDEKYTEAMQSMAAIGQSTDEIETAQAVITDLQGILNSVLATTIETAIVACTAAMGES